MATHNDQNQEVQVGHVVSIKFLTAICCILLFLTGVTVWVSRYDFTEINIAEMGIITALLVATVKATFVGLYFMHLRWDRPFIGFVFVGSILFVVLFIAFQFCSGSSLRICSMQVFPGCCGQSCWDVSSC